MLLTGFKKIKSSVITGSSINELNYSEILKTFPKKKRWETKKVSLCKPATLSSVEPYWKMKKKEKERRSFRQKVEHVKIK